MQCEPASKNTACITRIIVNSSDDLFKLESLIIKDSDYNMESIKRYRTNAGC